MGIVTVDMAKIQLGIAASNTSSDVELQFYCDGLTPAIEDYKGEVIVPREITQRLTIRNGSCRFRLGSTPLISLTSLVSLRYQIAYDVGPTFMDVDPVGWIEVINGPYPWGRVKAVYQAGYAVTPKNYQLGALMVLQDEWESQRGVGDMEGGVMDPSEERAIGRQYTPSSFRRARQFLGPPRPLIA